MRFFRDARYVTFSVFVSLVLTAVRSILVLRILGPELLGAWKSAMLLSIAGEFVRLGAFRGMGITVPVLIGQGKEEESEQTAAATGAFCLLMSVGIGLAIFGLSLFAAPPEMRTALRFTAVVVALLNPYTFVRELAAAHHLFLLRAKETLLGSLVDFVAVIVLCKLFGLAGFGAATALAILIPTLYVQQGQKFSFGLSVDFSRIKSLIRIGLPFSLTEVAFDVTRRLDALVMAPVLGASWVGYYGISLLIMDFSTQLALRGVSQVLSPQLLREFGRTGSVEDVAAFYETPARLFCYALPPVLGVGTLLIPPFVRVALPQYVPGILAAQVSLWTIFFVVLHSSVSSFFVAAEKISLILRLFAALIPLGAAAQFLVMKQGGGLLGSSWTMLATLALMVAAEICIARRSCGHSGREIAGFLGVLFFPLAASIALEVLVDSMSLAAWMPAPLEIPFKALLLVVFYIPVLVAYESRFCILRTVYETI